MAEIQNLKISNIECLEINLKNGREKYYLTDVAESLRNKKVVDIVGLSSNYSTSPTGNGLKDSRDIYLTISSKQKEIVKDYPFQYLEPHRISTRPSFNDIVPDWSKSYVTIKGETSSIGGNSIVLYVMFND